MFVFLIFTSFTGQHGRFHVVIPEVIWPVLVNHVYRKPTWGVFNWGKYLQHTVIVSIHQVPLQVLGALAQDTN